MTLGHSEQEEATLAHKQVNILLSIGGLFHIDHLLKLGWPKRIFLFDPAWQEKNILEQELELLEGLAHIEKKVVLDGTTFAYCVSEKGKHALAFFPTPFDGRFVENADVIHGPHLIHETGWPDELFNEKIRKKIKTRAKEDAVLFNI